MTETERATRDFVEGVRTGDTRRMRSARRAIRELARTRWSVAPMKFEMKFDWRDAMRRIARLDAVPKPARLSFMRLCVQLGHYIRLEVADDVVLIDAFRVMLPPYKGPAVMLYRGVGERNLEDVVDAYRRNQKRKPRRSRILPYGLAWTTNRDLADGFAVRHRSPDNPYRGGVILQTLAPPEAIICSLPPGKSLQAEYLVDTRLLQQVDWTRLGNSDHWTMDTIEDGWENETEEEAEEAE